MSAVVAAAVDAVNVTVTAAVTLARRVRVVPLVTSSLSSVAVSDAVAAVAVLPLLLRIEKVLDVHGVWTWIQDHLHDGLLLPNASLKGLGTWLLTAKRKDENYQCIALGSRRGLK